mmetsp:Transcript_35191/g.82018  ORF Transcript_35191/g.82018 Transcript_35191/m.82018 type:complete len:233 (+) Transcript_35191:183-881(+)
MLVADDLLEISGVLHDLLPVLFQEVPAGALQVGQGRPARIFDRRKNWNHRSAAKGALGEKHLTETCKTRKKEAICQREHVDGEFGQFEDLLIGHAGDLFRRQHRLKLIGVEKMEQSFQGIAVDVFTQFNGSSRHGLPHSTHQHGAEVRASRLEYPSICTENAAIAACNKFDIDPGTAAGGPINAAHVGAKRGLQGVRRLSSEDPKGNCIYEKHHPAIGRHTIRFDSVGLNAR